ncbi:MAG: sulfatase, partial [bacterium]|nr:sulfatase [bacterium]
MRDRLTLVLLTAVLTQCASYRDISFDFAKHFGRAAVIHEQGYLDIGTPEAQGALVEGWGNPENSEDVDVVWAVEKTAEIEVLLTDVREQQISFSCRPLNPSESAPRTIKLMVNGRYGGQVELRRGYERYTLDLEPETLVRGRNRVELQLTHAAAFDYFAFGGARRPASKVAREEPKQDGGSLHQPAGTEIAYTLQIPEDAKLEFYTTVDGDNPEAVLNAEVALRRQDGLEVVVHSHQYKGNVGGGHTVDLAPHAGSLVDVVFRASANVRAPGLGLVWRAPRLTGASNEAFETSVLFIVVDTLRADHLGCYGGSPKTPNLDALAGRGVTFENAYSHIPITGPSHSSMFTSLLPAQHGVLVNTHILSPRHLTLAEMMQALHHRTAGFVSLGTLRAQFGMAQGFDVYEDRFQVVGWKTARQVNEEVIPWLPELGDENFFLMVHYSDPHEPYSSPDGVFPTGEVTLNGQPAGSFPVNGTPVSILLSLRPGENTLRLAAADSFSLRGHSISGDAELEFGEGWKLLEYEGKVFEATTAAAGTIRISNRQGDAHDRELRFFSYEHTAPELVRRRYVEEVEFVDRHIGELLEELERRGQLDNTLIVFTSDHGEGLGDHGHIGHVNQLYNSLTRVPLILSFPGRLPEGKRITTPAAHIDLYPTILSLLGVETRQRIEGMSLLGVIDGD